MNRTKTTCYFRRTLRNERSPGNEDATAFGLSAEYRDYDDNDRSEGGEDAAVEGSFSNDIIILLASLWSPFFGLGLRTVTGIF